VTTETVALRWYNLRDGVCIGVVALIDREPGYFKVYLGMATGTRPEFDARVIASSGVPICDEPVARALIGDRPQFVGLRYEF
jgi:hypothetical protein